MKLYSYVVLHDFGFAPNPFHGTCTLATCKPNIRRAASPGDWIVGTGAKANSRGGKLIYAMRVGEHLTYDQYWKDVRFAIKRPVLRGSKKLMYGDNIYHHDARGRWLQADSHHSRPNGRRHLPNLARDTRADRVLIADWFVYYGADAPDIPSRFRAYGKQREDVCLARQGQKTVQEPLAGAFVKWLLQGPHGLIAFPAEFKDQVSA